MTLWLVYITSYYNEPIFCSIHQSEEKAKSAAAKIDGRVRAVTTDYNYDQEEF